MANNDPAAQAAHDAAIGEWARAKSRAKETAEAMERGVSEYIAEALRDGRNKQNLGQQGLSAMKAAEAGEDPVKSALGRFKGTEANPLSEGGSGARFGDIDDGECTGYEERPWERR